jgi:cold shock CspA family protein
MKKLIVSLCSLVFAFTMVAGVSFAADKAADKAAPAAADKKAEKKEAAKAEKATGTVKSIDREKGELVVTEESGTDVTFSIKKTQAKEVKDGDKVTVSYETKDGKNIAKRVTKVKEKKATKKETK